MRTWDKVLEECSKYTPIHLVVNNYIKSLQEYTGRTTIGYFTALSCIGYFYAGEEPKVSESCDIE